MTKKFVNNRFIREPEVQRLTGLSRSTRWRLEQDGDFPNRHQISPNAIAWLESDIQNWIAERVVPMEESNV
ncbi:MAG: AlpA family phage regulatory protein [Proteobacteria bacterium]|nr:AlpA family phage regulatory protein [Pseudomonadota bacterium]